MFVGTATEIRTLVADVELPLVGVLTRMEQTGVAVDTDHLESLETGDG